jgi:hypothetical protein
MILTTAFSISSVDFFDNFLFFQILIDTTEFSEIIDYISIQMSGQCPFSTTFWSCVTPMIPPNISSPITDVAVILAAISAI